jgi:hypothetical protein
MKSSIRNRKALLRRVGAALLACAAMTPFAGGCDGGREGDRCVLALNAATGSGYRSSEECGAGLTCQTPATCVESYCCPADPTKSSNPYCNGTGCPAPEAGAPEAGGDDGGSDGPPAEAASEAGDAGPG